jgi:hypothetical protein
MVFEETAQFPSNSINFLFFYDFYNILYFDKFYTICYFKFCSME